MVGIRFHAHRPQDTACEVVIKEFGDIFDSNLGIFATNEEHRWHGTGCRRAGGVIIKTALVDDKPERSLRFPTREVVIEMPSR